MYIHICYNFPSNTLILSVFKQHTSHRTSLQVHRINYILLIGSDDEEETEETGTLGASIRHWSARRWKFNPMKYESVLL